MFFKIGVLKNFVNFTGKHLCWNLFLTKLQARRPEGNSVEKRLQHRAFPVKFTKFLRTLFLQNTLVAVSGSKQCKPMKNTMKVYAAEKEMIYLKGSSKVSVSR